MAKREVAFASTVTPVDGGVFNGVLMYAQGIEIAGRLEEGAYKFEFKGKISLGRVLQITTIISALTTTKYKIEYRCDSDGQNLSDTERPSPLEGSVKSKNYAQEIIKIRF